MPTGPLAATQDFATVGAVVRGSTALDGSDVELGPPSLTEPIGFRYSVETKTYTLSAPDFVPGALVPDTSSAWAGDYDIATGADTSRLQRLRVYLNPEHRDGSGITLTYTGFGVWGGVTAEGARTSTSGGIFAFGIPTAASDVPVTGSAKYTAHVAGQGMIAGWRGPIAIGGKAELNFDFSRGTLTGFMDPTLMDDWGPTPLGHYTFVDTVHGVGSPTFSGLLAIDGTNQPSGFLGRFTGPGAGELMASWFAPFFDPWGDPGAWGTMSGVWVGKKD
ncbi:MAG: hypothetical protein APF82_08710 [Sphingomonadales bacterium BRH_c42]|nr:MAG: hypothetical protein APF82_08710 [Sphingomonadales bacterium BRH_c42]